MATISKALNYKIIAETGDFQKSLKDAQRELKAAERVMIGSLEPAQRLEARLAALDAELKAGKANADDYAKAQERLRSTFAKTSEIEAQTKAIKELNKTRGDRVAGALGGVPVVGHLAGDIGKGVDFFSGNMTTAAAMTTAAGASIAAGTMAWKEYREEAARVLQITRQAAQVNMPVEAFQVVAKQAKQAGVSVDQVTDAFRQMNTTIGEVRAGMSEERGDAFRAIGLDVKALGSMKPEEVFLRISDGLKTIRDPYQRATVSAKIFGEESAKLNDVLQLGTDRFKSLGDSMRAGYELFSADDAKRIKEADLAIQGLSQSWGTLKQNIAIAAAPEVAKLFTSLNTAASTSVETGMGERLKEYVRASTQFGLARLLVHPLLGEQAKPEQPTEREPDKIAESPTIKAAREAAKKADDERKAAAKSLREQYDALQLVVSGQAETTEAAKIMQQAQKGGEVELGRSYIKLLEQKKAMDEAAAATKQAAEETARLKEELQVANLPLEKQAVELERLRALKKGVSQEVANDVANARYEKQARLELNQIIEGSLTPLDRYRKRLGELNALQQRFPAFANQLNQGLIKAREELAKALGIDADKLQTPQEQFRKEIEAVNKAMEAGVVTAENAARARALAMQKYIDAGRPKNMGGVDSFAANSKEMQLAQAAAADEEAAMRRAQREADKITAEGRQAKEDATLKQSQHDATAIKGTAPEVERIAKAQSELDAFAQWEAENKPTMRPSTLADRITESPRQVADRIGGMTGGLTPEQLQSLGDARPRPAPETRERPISDTAGPQKIPDDKPREFEPPRVDLRDLLGIAAEARNAATIDRQAAQRGPFETAEQQSANAGGTLASVPVDVLNQMAGHLATIAANTGTTAAKEPVQVTEASL